MPLRGVPTGRYRGAESPGKPSRERVGPGKVDTAPKVPPGFSYLGCAAAVPAIARDQAPGPSVPVSSSGNFPASTSSATARIVTRRSIEVFWIQRNASGSERPHSD